MEAKNIEQKEIRPINGYLMLILIVAAWFCEIGVLAFGAQSSNGILIGVGTAGIILIPLLCYGLKIVNPNEAMVLTLFGNYYGTPLPYVKQMLDEGKNVILEIEVKGAFQVKEKCPEAVLIFLAPPSMKELEDRLIGRGTETPEVVAERLARAMDELDLVDDYDYVVVNDDVDEAVNDIRSIVKAEQRRAARNTGINKKIKGVD